MESRAMADAWSFLHFDDTQVKPPITTNSVKNFDPAVVVEDAARIRIVVHSRFPRLVDEFLAHKREHGSTHEKRLYSNITRESQISRLIAVSFRENVFDP